VYLVELDKRTENGVTIVKATERVDGVTSPELETYIADLAKETSSNIILDFSELKYISSAGLRVVLSTAKKLKAQKRELFLSGLTGSVKDVFQMSGFYAILKIFDTTTQALEQC
jgi:anti-anti-sigma factor